MQAKKLPCKMPAGQKTLGKKIAQTDTKRQPMPATAKAATKQMGELMTRKVHHTQAMREQRQKKAKYR